jgi:hypothetical integral membrane protein (TIGR02206 family)
VNAFEPFGALHALTVAVLASAVAGLSLLGRRLRGTVAGRRYESGLAVAVALLWLGYQAFDIRTRGFDPRYALPLQLCDLAAVVAALAFLRPRRWAQALAYFWGLALGTQAVFTPDLSGGPATLGFWAFWLYHLFVVGAGVYVVAAQGFRPKASDLRFAVGLGVGYAIVAFTIDAVFDLNYGYLGRGNPGQPSLLEFLGPWPIRCLWMVLLGSAAMAILWLPWWALGRRGGRNTR